MKDQLQLKWYHFLLSWLFCLLTGLLLGTIFCFVLGEGISALGISVAITIGAALCSAPFIILFCLVVHFVILKKVRPQREIHSLVFLLHIIGSILVFGVMLIFIDDSMNESVLYLIALMGGYFVIDSFYFHLYINKKAVKEHYENTPDSEILDSNLI